MESKEEDQNRGWWCGNSQEDVALPSFTRNTKKWESEGIHWYFNLLECIRQPVILGLGPLTQQEEFLKYVQKVNSWQ